MQNHMKRYSIFRPVKTAGQLRFQQGGASNPPLPPICWGRAYGRWRDFARALPKALRLPRELSSPSLLSGFAAIILTPIYNGDGSARLATQDS